MIDFERLQDPDADVVELLQEVATLTDVMTAAFGDQPFRNIYKEAAEEILALRMQLWLKDM